MIKSFFLTLVAILFFAVSALAGININTADSQTLQQLKGIGPTKANAIIEYREKHGPFQSADDLVNVKGIGKKTVDKIRDEVETEEPSAKSDKKDKK